MQKRKYFRNPDENSQQKIGMEQVFELYDKCFDVYVFVFVCYMLAAEQFFECNYGINVIMVFKRQRCYRERNG